MLCTACTQASWDRHSMAAASLTICWAMGILLFVGISCCLQAAAAAACLKAMYALKVHASARLPRWRCPCPKPTLHIHMVGRMTAHPSSMGAATRPRLVQMVTAQIDEGEPEAHFVAGMARAHLAGELHMEPLPKQHAPLTWHLGHMQQGAAKQ